MNSVTDILTRLGLTLQTVKTAFAAALSWFIATSLLHAEYPYFAAVAAIITVQVTVADSVDKAMQRIVGIIGGVLLSMLLGRWFQVSTVSIFFIILIGMAIARALRMNQQIVSQVAISSLLVLAFGQAKEGYAYERVIETIIGSAIALLINALIIPRNAVPDVEQSLQSFSNLAGTTLFALTTLLNPDEPRENTGRAEVDVLLAEAEKCRKALELAEQSLKYNPLFTHKRARLNYLAKAIQQLNSITIQIRGIRRSLADINTLHPFELEPVFREQLQHAIEATANCIAAYGQAIIQATAQNLATLQDAVNTAARAQANCLNTLYNISTLAILRDMGSILTDLGRIVSETKAQ